MALENFSFAGTESARPDVTKVPAHARPFPKSRLPRRTAREWEWGKPTQ